MPIDFPEFVKSDHIKAVINGTDKPVDHTGIAYAKDGHCFTLEWGGAGFGQMRFAIKDGKMVVDSECMNADSVVEVLTHFIKNHAVIE